MIITQEDKLRGSAPIRPVIKQLFEYIEANLDKCVTETAGNTKSIRFKSKIILSISKILYCGRYTDAKTIQLNPNEQVESNRLIIKVSKLSPEEQLNNFENFLNNYIYLDDEA